MHSLRRHILLLVTVSLVLLASIIAGYCEDLVFPEHQIQSVTSIIVQDDLDGKHLSPQPDACPHPTTDLLPALQFLSAPLITINRNDTPSVTLPNVFFDIFVPPQKHT